MVLPGRVHGAGRAGGCVAMCVWKFDQHSLMGWVGGEAIGWCWAGTPDMTITPEETDGTAQLGDALQSQPLMKKRGAAPEAPRHTTVAV